MRWELGQPTRWTAEPPPPPRQVVDGILRYGGVTLLVGPEGSAKSITALALAVAVSRGEDWLGRSTEQGPVLILDEENADDDIIERGWGLGLRPDDAGRLRHYGPCGVALADPDRAAVVEQVVADLRPTLLVVDGAVSAGGTSDASDNSAVGRLYSMLLPLAKRHDLAVLLLHHPPKGDPTDDAALGAGAWRRLAAAHFTQRQSQPHYLTKPMPDGGVVERYRYTMASTSKVRWGPGAGWEQQLAVVSERDADGAMRWMRVEAEGDPVAKHGQRSGSAEPTARARIVDALKQRGPLSRRDLADAVGMAHGGGGFKGDRAKGTGLLGLLDAGEVVECDDGRIALRGVRDANGEGS